ncbi:transcription antitermination factor NusB [Patescibacteria group bacterium]
MKTAKDPRHIRREKTVRSLFSFSFLEKNIKNQFALKIVKSKKKIDQAIAKAAPEWPIDQINRIDLAILRLAVFELAVTPLEPPKVVIDEAVELAKKYGSEKSPSFINGVLGTVFKNLEKKKKKKVPAGKITKK